MKLIYKRRQADLPMAGEKTQFVRIWDVPASYKEDGFFVGSHGPGELPPVPACAGGDATLLAGLSISGEGVDVGFLISGARVED